VWRPAALSTINPEPHRSVRSSVKIGMASFLRQIPYAEKLLASEVFTPWESLNVPNLVMLRKIHHDNRDWKHFFHF
jgi:hypothetical protein